MDQYIRLRNILQHDKKYKEFSSRLGRSSINSDPYYLGLLLLNVLYSNKDDIHLYLALFKKFQIDPNFQQPKGFFQSKDTRRSTLMVACEKSNKISVQTLLAYEGINLQSRDEKGRNAFFYALLNESESCSCQIINALLGKEQKLINSVDEENKNLLFVAVERKSLKLIKKLLDLKVNPNVQIKKTGNTVLHQLVRNAKISDKEKQKNSKSGNSVKQIISLLLENGVNPLLKNKDDENCLVYCRKHNIELEECLKAGINLNNKENINFQQNNRIRKILENQNFHHNQEDDQSSFSSDNQSEDDFDQRLSSEIISFSIQADQIYQEAWKDIQPIYCGILCELSNIFNLQINIIGSFATGLWTPSSDINIMYTNTDPKTAINIDMTLEKMQKILKGKAKSLSISKVYIKRSPKFPKLKVQLSVNNKNRKIDISIFHRNTSSCKYVCFISQQLQKNIYLRPLFFVIHEILRHFKMNSIQKGGLQNYILFLMIWVVIEDLKTQSIESIGQIFRKVLQKFTYVLHYEQKIQEGEYKKVLNIRDPLNPMNCLGSWQTNAQKLQQTFKAINYGLSIYRDENVLSYLCGLSKIFN